MVINPAISSSVCNTSSFINYTPLYESRALLHTTKYTLLSLLVSVVCYVWVCSQSHTQGYNISLFRVPPFLSSSCEWFVISWCCLLCCLLVCYVESAERKGREIQKQVGTIELTLFCVGIMLRNVWIEGTLCTLYNVYPLFIILLRPVEVYFHHFQRTYKAITC